MTPRGLNDYREIRKARRAKRLRARELARKKREIGARALVGYAIRHGNEVFRGFRTGYGKEAREEWPNFI